MLSELVDKTAHQGGFVSIGNFDGVHRGHQMMVSRLVELARREGVPAVVLTFDPHPIELLRPNEAPPSLSTLDRKTELLQRLGVDCVICYPTDERLLQLEPGEFFQTIVLERLAARGMVEGPNFYFGRNRTGDVNTLRKLCQEHGLHLEIVEPFAVGEQLVSSSAIRDEVADGQIADAVHLLGHPYQICGHVEPGDARGRELGFPTANMAGIETLIPPTGVYTGIWEDGGKTYAAAVHIGPNPTFGESNHKVEVHLLDFTGDLYGREMKIGLLDRVRGTIAFDSVDALKQQMNRDISQVRETVDAYLADR